MSIPVFLAAFASVFILPLFLPRLFNKLFDLPEIPKEWSQTEDILICTYRIYDLSWVVILFLEMGLGLVCGFVDSIVQLKFADAFGMFMIVCMCGGTAIVLAIVMKIAVIIFHPEGIVHRTALLANTYVYPNEAVREYYLTYGKSAGVIIKTTGKNITLSHFAANYKQAKELVMGKYPRMNWD